jgi:uncharacterized coiled-coil protein SlyX
MELLKNVQIGLLVAYLGRVLVLGANLSEMGIIFSLVALNISKDYLEKQKRIKDIEQEVNTRVAEVENTIKIQNEVIEKMARALDELRTSVASLKLSQGLVKRA